MTDVHAEYLEQAIIFLGKKVESLTGVLLEILDNMRGAPAFEIPTDDEEEAGYIFDEEDDDEDDSDDDE